VSPAERRARLILEEMLEGADITRH